MSLTRAASTFWRPGRRRGVGRHRSRRHASSRCRDRWCGRRDLRCAVRRQRRLCDAICSRPWHGARPADGARGSPPAVAVTRFAMRYVPRRGLRAPPPRDRRRRGRRSARARRSRRPCARTSRRSRRSGARRCRTRRRATAPSHSRAATPPRAGRGSRVAPGLFPSTRRGWRDGRGPVSMAGALAATVIAAGARRRSRLSTGRSRPRRSFSRAPRADARLIKTLRFSEFTAAPGSQWAPGRHPPTGRPKVTGVAPRPWELYVDV